MLDKTHKKSGLLRDNSDENAAMKYSRRQMGRVVLFETAIRINFFKFRQPDKERCGKKGKKNTDNKSSTSKKSRRKTSDDA